MELVRVVYIYISALIISNLAIYIERINPIITASLFPEENLHIIISSASGVALFAIIIIIGIVVRKVSKKKKASHAQNAGNITNLILISQVQSYNAQR